MSLNGSRWVDHGCHGRQEPDASVRATPAQGPPGGDAGSPVPVRRGRRGALPWCASASATAIPQRYATQNQRLLRRIPQPLPLPPTLPVHRSYGKVKEKRYSTMLSVGGMSGSAYSFRVNQTSAKAGGRRCHPCCRSVKRTCRGRRLIRNGLAREDARRVLMRALEEEVACYNEVAHPRA
jgi:hypothetical protein